MVSKAFNGLFHAHERISYRRLMAFGAATALIWMGRIDADAWVYVCIAFIAGEAAPKMMSALKGK